MLRLRHGLGMKRREFIKRVTGDKVKRSPVLIRRHPVNKLSRRPDRAT
jgi:hypothetical protein